MRLDQVSQGSPTSFWRSADGFRAVLAAWISYKLVFTEGLGLAQLMEMWRLMSQVIALGIAETTSKCLKWWSSYAVANEEAVSRLLPNSAEPSMEGGVYQVVEGI